MLYWLANYSWDFLNYLLSAVLCIIIFAIFNSSAYTGRNFHATATLLLVYGWAIIPMMYPACFYFDVPSTAYVTLIVANLFIGLTATLATYILELFPDDPELNSVGSTLKIVFLIFPNYCFGRGLMDIAKNEYLTDYTNLAAKFGQASYKPFVDPLAWGIAGRNVMSMVIQGFVFFGITLAIEFYQIRNMSARPSLLGRIMRALGCSRGIDGILDYLKSNRDVQNADSDVVAEAMNAYERDYKEKCAVVVRDLSKIYGSSDSSRKVGVNRLSFTVRRGECFGLLGVNGAGLML